MKNEYRKKCAASLTVEASLVFPIFLFAVLSLVWLFNYMEVKYEVTHAIAETARDISSYGLAIELLDGQAGKITEEIGIPKELGEIGRVADEFILKKLVVSRLEDRKRLFDIVEGGTDGISFQGSELFSEGSKVIIKCNYRLRVPYCFFKSLFTRVEHNAEYKYYTGYGASVSENDEDDSGEETEYVYITETGKVYHSTIDCPSLKVSVRRIPSSEIDCCRNKNGGIYSKCWICGDGDMPETVYITEEGNRYHYSAGCSSLKRNIRKVKKSETEGRRACKRCLKQENLGEQ